MLQSIADYSRGQQQAGCILGVSLIIPRFQPEDVVPETPRRVGGARSPPHAGEGNPPPPWSPQPVVNPPPLPALPHARAAPPLPPARFEPIEHFQRLLQLRPSCHDLEADDAELAQPPLGSPQAALEPS